MTATPVVTGQAAVAEHAVPGHGAVPGHVSVPGHVGVPAKVLQKVATAVVAETLRVRRADVRVEAADGGGRLALRVSTPVRIPVLSEAAALPDGGVVAIVRDLQSTLTRRFSELAGRTVSRVDVTVSGSRIDRTGAAS